MNLRAWHGVWIIVIASVSTGLAAGCNKKEDQPQRPNGGEERKGDERTGPSLADEDPDLVDYAKKKNWVLVKDRRLADNRPIIALFLDDKVKLTAHDYKLIAKAKTIQAIEMHAVKNLTDDGLKAIVGIPTLENIGVGGGELTDASLKVLAQAKSLEVVGLRDAKKVTSAGIKELAALPKLKELWIQFMEFDGAALEAFAGSKTLHTVNLEWAEGLTDDGIKHLGKLPNLNVLKIDTGYGKTKLSSAGIKAIVDVHLPANFEFSTELLDDPLFESLVAKGWLYGPGLDKYKKKRPATAAEVDSINVKNSKVTDKGFQAVLNCTNVAYLFLENSAIGDETFKKLGGFKKLEYLSLSRAKVTGVGLDAIAHLPIKHVAMEYNELSEEHFKAFGKMTSLEQLWLRDTKMNADWLKHIVKLPKLKDLNLQHAALDDANAKLVAGMTSMQSVSAHNTKLTNEGMHALLKLPNLKYLSVDNTDVTKDAYLKAKQDYPKITLYYYNFDR